MTNFIDNNNLINSKPDEVHAENSPLWTLEFILLNRLYGRMSIPFELALEDFIKKCEISTGLFNQRTFMDGTPEDYTSHDQLTAIMCFSHLSNRNWHREIWAEIKRQKFRYDNINPDKPSWNRTLHPRDIIYYGILNNVLWCKLLFPIFVIITLISCKSDTSTSGKLLAFVRLSTLKGRIFRFKWLFTLATKAIKSNKNINSWKKAFGIYFPYDNHPITKLINKYSGENTWV